VQITANYGLLYRKWLIVVTKNLKSEDPLIESEDVSAYSFSSQDRHHGRSV
jgi:hypothetical protein